MERVLRGFFALLGWRISEDKDHGFQEEFAALGIWVSFSRFLHSEVLFFNTPSRIQEVSAYLNSLLEVRTSTRKEGTQAFCWWPAVWKVEPNLRQSSAAGRS